MSTHETTSGNMSLHQATFSVLQFLSKTSKHMYLLEN